MLHLAPNAKRDMLVRAVKTVMALHLFTNELTMDDDPTRITSYREPTGGGYEPQFIQPSEWVTQVEPDLALVLKDREFTFNAPQDFKLRGFFVTANDGTRLVMSDVFPMPVELNVIDDGVNIDLVFKLRTTNPELVK